MPLSPLVMSAGLLAASNVFMTFAWSLRTAAALRRWRCRSLRSCRRQPIKLDYLWASLCIMGAVYFIFRG